MKNLSVADGLFVEIEYVLTEEGPDGEVLEECSAEQAFGFRMGAGEVLPAFEKALLGKKTGEPFSFTIPCAEAYGETTTEAIHTLPKSIFEVDVSDTEVEMDFNHPFADIDLHFEGTVCDIREEE